MASYKKLKQAIDFAKRYFHESKIWMTPSKKYEVNVASKLNVPKSWKLLMHIQEGKIIAVNKKYKKLIDKELNEE